MTDIDCMLEHEQVFKNLKTEWKKRNREDQVQKGGQNRPVTTKQAFSEAEIQPKKMFHKFKSNTISNFTNTCPLFVVNESLNSD